jgi:WS/DGAT/MGAT family acyltransferase
VSLKLTPSDAMFLYGESREVMMHVGSMMPFTPPPGTPRDYLRHVMDEIRAGVKVERPWNLRLRTPGLLKSPLHEWIEDDKLDLEYHVRRSALPAPGDERELGILVSRLHGYPIDFHRPPWELHLIEGLEGGRMAMYVKVHHALVDGVTASKILQKALTTNSDDRARPFFFSIPPPERKPREGEAPDWLDQTIDTVGMVAKAFSALVRNSREEHDLVTPRQAPKCVLNARISRARRFATQRLELSRVKAVAKASGGTLNDVLLALSSASLRRYLAERDALPAETLIAMLPVNVRAADDAGGGNAVGALLASLATDIEDPAERMAEIMSSTAHAKAQLTGMSKDAILAYSGLLTSPSLAQMLPGTAGRVKPTFNVVISNVPGPEQPLYFRGALLEANYPLSVPVHGQALNITCVTYAGAMCVGFTGCRDTLPHLQRLAVYFGEALAELEVAFNV